MESLTGFDLIAIRKAFGMSMAEMQGVDQLMLVYALVFILKRREGQDDRAAYQSSQSLTLADAQGHFAEIEDDPEGKGD